MPHRRFRVLSISIRVHVDYTAGTESQLQIDGCNAVVQDQFFSSYSYGRAAGFLGSRLFLGEYPSPAAPISSRLSNQGRVCLLVFYLHVFGSC